MLLEAEDALRAEGLGEFLPDGVRRERRRLNVVASSPDSDLILAVTGMLLVLAEAFYKGEDRTALVGLAAGCALKQALHRRQMRRA